MIITSIENSVAKRTLLALIMGYCKKISGVLCLSICILSAAAMTSVHAAEVSDAQSLEELLGLVKQGRLKENREYKQRETRFIAERSSQAQVLSQIQSQRLNEEQRSEALNLAFDQNDKAIDEGKQRLAQALGDLKELFGHVTTMAGDARGNLSASIINVHYPQRTQFLDELIAGLSDSTNTPDISKIERLWYELQREMVESGKVVKFKANVLKPNGEQVKSQVVRVGTYNLVTQDGNYLQVTDQGALAELSRQPAGKYTKTAERLVGAKSGFQQFGVDPTGPQGGSYLAAIVGSPTLIERWHQGGVVGYIISAIGVFALIIAAYRLISIAITAAQVNAQLRSETPNRNNPLGRVLAVHRDNPDVDPETLELKLSEQVLKEVPILERSLNLLKIIAAVAPLLGLLGTVTGMIITFQAITIFGAGDPKAMAGGISGALVTTVLGLVVAIPVVLLHTLLNSRAKRIIQLIEERSTGIIAERNEASHS